MVYFRFGGRHIEFTTPVSCRWYYKQWYSSAPQSTPKELCISLYKSWLLRCSKPNRFFIIAFFTILQKIRENILRRICTVGKIENSSRLITFTSLKSIESCLRYCCLNMLVFPQCPLTFVKTLGNTKLKITGGGNHLLLGSSKVKTQLDLLMSVGPYKL